ncbi:MAG: hypothetical protein LBD71_07630 [Treponema sp.]|jgi:hypothetical protein|nr:hypothetical protein [Treponema sp.]
MSLFCFLWMFLFYFFRRSCSPGEEGSGGVWALILGCLAALLHFLLGSFIVPGGFGFSRWLSGFVDIVCLPVLLPLFVYFLLMVLRIFRGKADFANFALLWLIPAGAIRAVGWSAGNNPVLLVLVPLLWTALACGIPLFIDFMAKRRVSIIISSAFAILAMPFLASVVYWAFFSQRNFLGAALLSVTLIPAVISVVLFISASD